MDNAPGKVQISFTKTKAPARNVGVNVEAEKKELEFIKNVQDGGKLVRAKIYLRNFNLFYHYFSFLQSYQT